MSDQRFFADPHPDHAREVFRHKPRALAKKVTSVADAVSRLVCDGDYLAIGGFGTNRIPTAVCHEIIRQKKQNLSFAGHTATHDFQILCAGNLTDRGQTLTKVDSAYIVGLEARGLSPHARRVMESGTIQVSEWSNYALAVRFRAAAMGVPFLPVRSMLGTDTGRYSGAAEITCPYTGMKLLALPAIYPDVAAIHVHEADVYGNARLRGTSVADLDVARAAKRLIITCERLVSAEEFRSEPDRTSIPYYCVDAVCEVPYGSYPGNMPYEYFSDEDHLKLWLSREEDPAGFRRFLEEAIWNQPDFDAYLDWAGGLKRMQQLRQQEFLF